MRTPLTCLLLALLVTTSACGDDTDSATADNGSGRLTVRLEPTDAVFIEGFEIGLRFETAGGEVIDSILWSDFVAGLDDQSLEAYYDSVFVQEVPAGPVVVLAIVNIGIGPAPETPDLAGDMPCRLEVDVPDGGQVDVEVAFSDRDCLSLVRA